VRGDRRWCHRRRHAGAVRTAGTREPARATRPHRGSAQRQGRHQRHPVHRLGGRPGRLDHRPDGRAVARRPNMDRGRADLDRERDRGDQVRHRPHARLLDHRRARHQGAHCVRGGAQYRPRPRPGPEVRRDTARDEAHHRPTRRARPDRAHRAVRCARPFRALQGLGERPGLHPAARDRRALCRRDACGNCHHTPVCGPSPGGCGSARRLRHPGAGVLRHAYRLHLGGERRARRQRLPGLPPAQ
jgi:hypothetical protein